jgi:hypothetical protein
LTEGGEVPVGGSPVDRGAKDAFKILLNVGLGSPGLKRLQSIQKMIFEKTQAARGSRHKYEKTISTKSLKIKAPKKVFCCPKCFCKKFRFLNPKTEIRQNRSSIEERLPQETLQGGGVAESICRIQKMH